MLKTKSPNIDPASPAARIAEKFGGITALAEALDPPRTPSSVQYWCETGFIPAREQAGVLAAAKRKRIRLSPSEFIPASNAA
jgi:hypothetical protein